MADDAIFVQHIQGYDSGSYETRARRMRKAGFVRLRSRKGRDGKYWEIWYLCGAWAAKGEIANMKHADIKAWLFREIRPGQTWVDAKMWALGVPD